MTKKRRQYSPELKFNVALEAAKGRMTISKVASEMEARPKQIGDWKRPLQADPSADAPHESAGDLSQAHHVREDIYLKDYASGPELVAGLKRSFGLYNDQRPPQSVGYHTPAEIHFAL